MGIAYVGATLGTLPASIATSFGGAGVPHAWMTHRMYVGYLAAIGLLLPLLAMGLVALNPTMRVASWWLGSLFVGFALGLHSLLLAANRAQPARLSTAAFVTVLALFVVGLGSWVVRWRHAVRPPI